MTTFGSAFLSFGCMLYGFVDILAAAENILGPRSGNFIRHCLGDRYARNHQENKETRGHCREVTAGKGGLDGRGFVTVKKSCPSFFQVD